jgi:hypothetical protein
MREEEKICYKEHQRDCQTMKTIYFINSILKLLTTQKKKIDEHNETQILLFILPIL